MEDIRIVDDWHVLGLSATGSRTLELNDVLVPAYRTVAVADLSRGDPPGRYVHPDYALLRAPRGAFATFSQSPVAVALGHRAVEHAVGALANRVTRVWTKAAESEVVQMHLAESAAEIDAATLILDHSRKRSMDRLTSGDPFSSDDVLRPRRDVALALRLVRVAVDRLCRLSGGQWIYDSSPLQTILRDALATSAHLTANFEAAMVPWARMRLGLDSGNPQ
jgi:3-hydroxy-9,10-secoandrosta-1,3,5(10)-triene-9,17-dione monooxygenase